MNKLNKNLVFFGEDWGGLPSSSQHFANELLDNGWTIVWVNSVGMRQPSLNLTDIKRLFNKLSSFFKSPNQATSNDSLDSKNPESLTILSPLIFPFIGYAWIDKINQYLFRKQLNNALQQAGFTQFTVLTALPTAVAFYPILKEFPWFYYCCDDFSGLANVSHQKVVDCERRLLALVIETIVSSQALYDKFSTNNPHLIEHGVDVELFATKQSPPSDLPKTKPIIGFYGSISEWLDQGLLTFCIKNNPDFNFVFIGKKAVDCVKLEQLDNVYFLGEKPHHLLPGYLHQWHVAILPFTLNRQIMGCNPLKLREYLAAGCYVVATNFPAAYGFDDIIGIAASQEAFSQLLSQAPVTDDVMRQNRRKRVAQMTWHNQTNKMEQILLESICTK